MAGKRNPSGLAKHISTAYDWHGGQDSALYSFASIGGHVTSDDHRHRLLTEINADLASAHSSAADRRKLEALRDYTLYTATVSRYDPNELRAKRYPSHPAESRRGRWMFT